MLVDPVSQDQKLLHRRYRREEQHYRDLSEYLGIEVGQTQVTVGFDNLTNLAAALSSHITV